MEYTKTLGIKSKGDKATLTLSNQGFEVGEFFVDNKDILFLNRYVNARTYLVEVVHTLVYAVGDDKVAIYEFVQNSDLKDEEFEDKLLFWANNENVRFEENDWSSFCPIVNGYKNRSFFKEEKDEGYVVKPLTLGVGIAGLIVLIVSAVLAGIGKTTFGAMGVVLGFLAFAGSVVSVFKKKK